MFLWSSVCLAFVLSGVFVKGDIKPCHKVRHPAYGALMINCTIVCSSHLLNYVTGTESEELPLCLEDSIALVCDRHEDCRKYYAGSMCRKIPCACEAQSGSHSYYVLDPKSANQIQSLKTCTVSTKWLNPDEPIVPFPWKTLLVVFGILASFSVCLVAIRWLSPFIREMQAKSERNRQTMATDEGQPFTAITLHEGSHRSHVPHRPPRIVANPNQRLYAHRRQLHNQCMESLVADHASSSDKPPPYEVAIQGPPTYETVKDDSHPPDCENTGASNDNRTSTSVTAV